MTAPARGLTVVCGSDAGPVLPEPFVARHLIGDAWRDSASGEIFERFSPAHGTLVSRSCLGGEAEAEAAVDAARTAFRDGSWPRLPGRSRAAVLARAADLIDERSERLALLETLETGKPLSQAKAEIAGAADNWRFASALARTVHGDSRSDLGNGMLGIVLKEPVGVVSIIAPWNFPSHQCGTARFGHDPRTSVLDTFCRAHDHPNLYVVDASFLPSSAALNPVLTVAAQALRVADHMRRSAH